MHIREDGTLVVSCPLPMDALKRAVLCAATPDPYYTDTGRRIDCIRMATNGTNLIVEATDGKRLTRATAPLLRACKAAFALVDPRHVRELIRSAETRAGGTTIHVGFGPNGEYRLETDQKDGVWPGGPIHGSWPPMDVAIPDTIDGRVSVATAGVRAAVAYFGKLYRAAEKGDLDASSVYPVDMRVRPGRVEWAGLPDMKPLHTLGHSRPGGVINRANVPLLMMPTSPFNDQRDPPEVRTHVHYLVDALAAFPEAENMEFAWTRRGPYNLIHVNPVLALACMEEQPG